MMTLLTLVESSLIKELIADHPDRTILHQQLSELRVLRKQTSQLDIQYEFCPLPQTVNPTHRPNQTISGKELVFTQSNFACAVNLYIKNGQIDALEIVSHGVSLPTTWQDFQVVPTQNIV